MDQFITIIDTAGRYKHEITAFIGTAAWATNGESRPTGFDQNYKFIRATGPLGPGVLASPPKPYSTTRLNTYRKPGGYTKLSKGLESLIVSQCSGAGVNATLTGPGDLPADLYQRIQIYAMGGLGVTDTADVAAPPCKQQDPQKPIGGPPKGKTLYPHVNAER
jgi:hypothetical protein